MHNQSTTPTISVIVPVYNAEKYLRRCIDSVLAQTYADFELLLIDDGSKDKSGEICDEYAQKDARVRVFHKENGGVSSARNLGLDNAKGEWVTFVDSDDYIKSRFLESAIINAHSDLVIGDSLWLDANDKIVACDNFSFTNLSKEEILEKYLYSGAFTVPWGKLYSHSIIANYSIRFNTELRFAEDLCFVYQYLLYVKEIQILDNVSSDCCLVNYVPNNIVGKYSMSTAEAARHFSFIWKAYKQLSVRCRTFEEIMINDIFELCKKKAAKNTSIWYENAAVREAYYLRAKNKGLAAMLKAILMLNFKLYKVKYSFLCL